jgi:hypothetical protein
MSLEVWNDLAEQTRFFTLEDLHTFARIITRLLTLPPLLLPTSVRNYYDDVLRLIDQEAFRRQRAPSPTYDDDDGNNVNSAETETDGFVRVVRDTPVLRCLPMEDDGCEEYFCPRCHELTIVENQFCHPCSELILSELD